MNEICGDNRFEIINKVKKRLLEATNIEQSPKELEVLDNLLFRLWQCGYFDYIETFEKNEMTFEEWYKKSDCELTGVTIGIARCIFQAGAKEVQKENKQLAKRICELQSDLAKAKSMNEKMQNCANCDYWFDLDSTCELTNEPIYDFMVDCGCKSWKCAYKMDNEELKRSE